MWHKTWLNLWKDMHKHISAPYLNLELPLDGRCCHTLRLCSKTTAEVPKERQTVWSGTVFLLQVKGLDIVTDVLQAQAPTANQVKLRPARKNEMNGVLGYSSALGGNTGPGIIWANEMNFGMNHTPGSGSVTQPVDLQSSARPLCYDFLHAL